MKVEITMKKYVKPYLDIVEFEKDDIITESTEETTVYDGDIGDEPELNFGTAPQGQTALASEDGHDLNSPAASHDTTVSTGTDYFFVP